jgi:two-component system nitrogen regulation response regulator NtrX
MKKILIVDDEPALRSALAELLSGEDDYQVFEAAHGVEGLDILKKEAIDLMLLDVDMPFLNGVDVVKAMQAEKEVNAQPDILVLTNRGDMNTVSEMMSLEMFDYIIKSDHSLEEIIGMVRKKLD